MARSKKTVQVMDTLELTYNLAELPSSQHRAGLAGLVLMVQWLHRFEEWKQDGAAICEVVNLGKYSVTLRINQLGLKALFDEVYGATEKEAVQYEQKPDEDGTFIQPIRTEEVLDKDLKTGKVKIDKKTGQPKTKTAYYYPILIPKGSFLADPEYDCSSDCQKGLWIKLWRDALFAVKVKPRSHEKYKSINKVSSNDWLNLTNSLSLSTVAVSGSSYMGAESKNPETIKFKNYSKYEFLLNFWIFASSIYVPQVLNIKREKDSDGKNRVIEKRDFVGYAIAVPDVLNLKIFCDEFFGLLKERGIEPAGYRPRDAVVDLAVEGALDMMVRLRDRVSRLESSIGDLVTGIDVFHIETINEKRKRLGQKPVQNNGSFLHGIIRLDPPEQEWIDQYREIRESLWHSIFRRQRLLNLVSNKAWYMGFDSLLCTIPYELTMENEFFRHDVRESFKYEVENMSEEMEKNDRYGSSLEYSCEKLVLRLVGNYVSKKLKDKYELEWKKEWTPLTKSTEGKEQLKKKEDYEEYAKKKAKIAKSAFLDVRSRTEKTDFINYFASTICSVSQHMNESDFENLTRDLYEDTDKVRTLTMLALSANG